MKISNQRVAERRSGRSRVKFIVKFDNSYYHMTRTDPLTPSYIIWPASWRERVRTGWRELVRKKPSGPAQTRPDLLQYFSYDKMLIDWVRSGRTRKYLALGHAARTSRSARSVRHDLEPNIFPSGPPTQSISTYPLYISNWRALWKNSLSDDFEKCLLSCVFSASVSFQTFAK